MTVKDRGFGYWMEKDEWSIIEGTGMEQTVRIADDAPEEAKKSFELWKKINNMP